MNDNEPIKSDANVESSDSLNIENKLTEPDDSIEKDCLIESAEADSDVGADGNAISKKAGKSKLREFISWVLWLGGAVIVALFISFFIIINSSVPSGSMESTIHVNDRIVGNRLAYLFSEPKRGEIIIFESNDSDIYLVKRLIGLPGETVKIDEGVVYINGVKLNEDYLGSVDSRSFGPFEVPEDSYFFLGDNRASSLDARLWDDHFIKKDALIGKVLFKYYSSFKTFSLPDYGELQ